MSSKGWVWAATLVIPKGALLKDVLGAAWVTSPRRFTVKEAFTRPNANDRGQELKLPDEAEWYWFYTALVDERGERLWGVRDGDCRRKGPLRRPRTVRPGAPFEAGKRLFGEFLETLKDGGTDDAGDQQ